VVRGSRQEVEIASLTRAGRIIPTSRRETSIRIDVHNHVIPERAVELLRRDPAYGVTIDGRSWSGGLHVDFEIADSFIEPGAKLAELDSKGLDAAVVSVAPPLFYHHVDAEAAGEPMARAVNRGLAEFCAHAPERLRWLASVPLQDPERAVAVLEDAVAAGCVGVEIGTAVERRRLDEPEFEPFWAGAERLGVPVTLHPAYGEPNDALNAYYFGNVLGFLFETTIAIERLIVSGVLDHHPALRVVLLHGGGYFPYQVGRLRHATTVRPELVQAPGDPWAYRDRLFFDIITHDPAALRYLIERAGADRVLMGTDLPFDMATPEPMRLLEAAADEAAAAAIAERNPASLYGFPQPGR
jgi:aminocarboxymuconate-semialdehyde decarboxylase